MKELAHSTDPTHTMKTRFQVARGLIFPRPTGEVEGRVTARKLAIAKWVANAIMRENLPDIKGHFTRYAVRRYKCKRRAIKFDEVGALQRLQKAELGVDEESVYGHTDGQKIVINTECPMGFGDVVATLVHEALHNFCVVRGKLMGCEREHVCMRGLGEII